MDHKNDLKLIDFGLGNSFTKGKGLKTSCGSPCFAAPEIINGIEYDAVKVDIWSLGVCFYCMLVGRLPFDEENKKELYRKIRTCSYKTPTYLSAVAISLLTSMLNLIPAARPSASGILAHPFFQKVSIGSISRGLNMGTMEDLYIISAYRSKIKPGTLKVMIENNEHNRQTTMLYLLMKKTERGDFDPGKERTKIEAEKKKEELDERDKKEDQYRKILGESQIDIQRANLKPKLKSSVTPVSGGFPLNAIYRKKPSINGPKGSSLLIDTQRPQSRRIMIDPALMKFKTEGNASTSIDGPAIAPEIPLHKRTLSIANTTTKSGSAKAVKQERSHSMPENGSEFPLPKKQLVENRNPIAPASIDAKQQSLDLDSRKASAGIKNYYIRQGNKLQLRRVRDDSDRSEEKIAAHQLSLLANLTGQGMPNLPNRGQNISATRVAGLGHTVSPSPYSVSSAAGYLLQNLHLSDSNPETFKVMPKNKLQDQQHSTSSRKHTKNLSRISDNSGELNLNRTATLNPQPKSSGSPKQQTIQSMLHSLGPRKINISIGQNTSINNRPRDLNTVM
jgi:serine/threonine protein kinase